MSSVEIVSAASDAPPFANEIVDDIRGPFRQPNVGTLCRPSRVYGRNPGIVQGGDYGARVVSNITHLRPMMAQPVAQLGEQFDAVEHLLIDLRFQPKIRKEVVELSRIQSVALHHETLVAGAAERNRERDRLVDEAIERGVVEAD